MFKIIFKSYLFFDHIGIYNKNEYTFFLPNAQKFNLFLIKSGSLSMKVENEIITAQAGEYIFFTKDNKIDYDEITYSDDLLFYQATFEADYETSDDIKCKLSSLPNIVVDYHGKLLNFDEIERFFKKTIDAYTNNNLVATLSYFLMILNLVFINNTTFVQKDTNPHIFKIKKYLQYRFQDNITLDQLSKLTNISATHINNLFKKYEGCTVMDYLNKYRIEIAKYYLEQGKFSTAQIAKFAGFNSTDYFCKVFKKYVGVSSKEYVKTTHLHYFSNFNDEIKLIDVMTNYL